MLRSTNKTQPPPSFFNKPQRMLYAIVCKIIVLNARLQPTTTRRHKLLCALAILMAFSHLVPAQDMSQAVRTVKELSQVSVGEIQAANVLLSEFLNELSENTGIAFCWENRYDNATPADTLGTLRISLAIAPTDNVQRILQRIQDSYPVVRWRIEEGIVVISAADIDPVPLNGVLKPFRISATVHDIVLYFDTHVPGLLADTTYISGMYPSKEAYSLKFDEGPTASQVLSRLTRDHGIRWYASVGDHSQALEIPDGPNGQATKTTTGRVTLTFHQGPVPLLVK
jgi:hypothetical protein